MALVLGGVGAFIYLRFASELDHTIDAGLESRADEVIALGKESDSGLGDSTREEASDSFAQVIGPDGGLLDSSEVVDAGPLLGAEALRRARTGPTFLDRASLPGVEDESRLLAVPVRDEGRTYVVVVGTSTADRDEALADLRRLLLIGGPLALLLASLAAYGVAAASLAPVEAMRARAAEISAADPERRLPVPPTGDELGRLGATLNEMLDRLGEALRHERAFVADASHELRTPLAILQTELELALADGRSPAELRAAISSATEEVDRLTQLAEDLLTIAQTEGGELPLRRDRVEVDEILERVRLRYARRAADADRPIAVRVEPGLELSADAMRLDQVVGNLVDNSLRYGSGTIEIEALAAADAVEVHVRDRGPGFPEEFVERAFERFSRASTARHDGGSGLGLAIAQTVVHAHGGEVHAENRPDGGADVWFAIPRGAE